MIATKEINKKFGKLQALDNVSFWGENGNCIALIGPNGCGKTTLIKSILGMVIPDSGTITVKGANIKNTCDYRRSIGYMPQIGRYPENMKIGQVIDMLIDIRNDVQKRDEDIVHAYSLASLYNKRMATLSGGTMQKVSAAIAFMFNPDILILDEPTAGLDPVAAEILKEKIQAEKQKGKLVLITSHILSDLDDLVSHILYMQDGRILFHRSTAELKTETAQDKLSKAIAHYMSLNK